MKGQVTSRLKSLFRVLFEATGNQPVEFGGNLRSGSREFLGRIPKNRRHRLGRGLTGKCAASGNHLVQHASKREDVAGRSSRSAANLFRGHVTGGAEHGASLSLSFGVGARACGGGFDSRQSEIQHFHPAIQCEKDVLRLQIAVRDAFGMRRRESFGQRCGDFHGLAPGRRAFAEPCAQGFAVQ